MKQLTQHIKEPIAIVKQQERKTEHKRIGSLTPKPGQKVWQLNIKTRSITEAEFENVTVDAKGKVHKKLLCLPGHLYAPAINLTNAKKQFNKQLTKLFMMHQKKAAV